MYYVYVQGDASSPYIMDGQDVLAQFICNLPAGSMGYYTQYDVATQGTTPFGMTGSPPPPTKPNPALTLENTNKIHVKKKKA